MIEQLIAYLSNESCDLENDTVSSILLDEDRIQIYFYIGIDYLVFISEILLFNKEGYEIHTPIVEMNSLMNELEDLLNEWVKPSDNTVHIEGRSYEI